MISRPIIDAGPALNFFSINKERLLLSVLGRISVPEAVEGEVLRKAASDGRFAAVAAVWAKLKPGDWLQVISDDVTPGLSAAVQRISGLPMAQRTAQAKDLGETMVVAHAVVAAEAGAAITVLIDDGRGAQVASRERERLIRLRAQGRPVGSILLANTPTILAKAAGSTYLPDKPTMRATYERLRTCDNGLPPIDKTTLLDLAVWT